MLNNTPEMFECHFGVPMTGAVLNTLNTRLDAETIAFMLNHGEAKVLITDREYSPMVKKALAGLGREILVIDVDDPEYTGPGERLGSIDYEAFLAGGNPDYAWKTRPTSGMRSRSTTPRAPPATPRAWSTTTAAPTSTRCPTSSPGACRRRPSTCGRCRCSIATAGASRGPWRPIPAPTSACAASMRS
jgi:acyl-CoA synthetase (AMP-forming)/AMP-acid ligase II